MIAHANDLSQNKIELSSSWDLIPVEKEIRTLRMGERVLNPRPSGVIAGQDLPANIVDCHMKIVPKLGLDLLSGAKDETTDQTLQVLCVNDRLETRDGDNLRHVVASLKSARDRHEQNIELIRDDSNVSLFCLRTLRPIRRGQPLLIWYGEALARELGIPILTPANIRGNQDYICTNCHSVFAQPNILKAHLFYDCSQTHQQLRNQSTLIPFQALLQNISACFISQARSPTSPCRIDSKLSNQLDLAKMEMGNTHSETQADVVKKNESLSVNVKTECNRTCIRLDKSPIHQCEDNNMAESTQNDLSPSWSSSSFDSFADENEDDELLVKGHISGQGLRQRGKVDLRQSAFHRPTPSSKRSRKSEDTLMTPDSSTDQRTALNLSIKQDHSLLSFTDHHKNLMTQTLSHSWPVPHTTNRAQVPYPFHYGAIPVYYPVNHNLPQAPLEYMAYNHHQMSRTLTNTRQSFESNVQNTELPLQSQLSPKRERGIPTISFSSPESCPAGNSSPPLNPYGLNLPSDKEPLDLLPQTYFTNKSKRGHLCLYCGKLYSRKYGLKIHMRTHNGYKPLKCKICSRPFGDPSNLNKHVRLHAQGDTPYRCDYCGKVLVRRRDLERHVRSRHPMGRLPVESSPPSSPISVEEVDTSSFHESTTSL